MSSNDASMLKRRPRKVLSPSVKYEIWLRLVRDEVTIAQATQAGVDRSTIVRVRQVAKDGAMAALAASRPVNPGKEPPGLRVGGGQRRDRPALRSGQGTGGEVDSAGEKKGGQSDALNRTGSDGGSGYWIPTKGWSDRCVA